MTSQSLTQRARDQLKLTASSDVTTASKVAAHATAKPSLLFQRALRRKSAAVSSRSKPTQPHLTQGLGNQGVQLEAASSNVQGIRNSDSARSTTAGPRRIVSIPNFNRLPPASALSMS